MTLDLGRVERLANDIAYMAGDVLMNFWQDGFRQTTKSSSIDVVTEADSAAESLIVSRLLTAFPDHHIIGEEGGGMGADIETAPYRWYVDPLDGTTNYANRIPIFAVSLALTDSAMNPLVGVVYSPMSDELFSAARGAGTTRNGQPVTVSAETALERSVLASGFPYDKHTSPQNNLREWGAMLVRSRGLRRLGAAALDCCYVADGRFDGYWEQKVKPWDVLAGMLCAEEAGATISDYDGRKAPGFIEAGRVVISNGHIHRQMLDVL
ncbi:MAG: inositol monophosphatase, partial [Anaerolineaceae bacterium]